MPFSPKSFESKPYNMCIDCIHIGKNCDGPNFLAMSTERWCEWCHLRKEYLGWTNAYVAELADISKVSVDRVMSGNVKDLRISTMQAVTKALVNGSWGQYPCVTNGLSEPEIIYAESPELVDKLNKADAECKRLQSVLERINEERKADVAAAHTDEQKRIEYLKEQMKVKDEQMVAKDNQLKERYDYIMMSEKRKNKVIAVLAISLAVTLLIIIAALVIDRLHSDIGFFWIDRMSAFFTGEGGTAVGTNHLTEIAL